ncbi:MAG: hypothetical protein JRM76_03600, partial [Nitrososphaerota archaeon]|nr:hypothetical protein [Nitrososphaerota archaeon]
RSIESKAEFLSKWYFQLLLEKGALASLRFVTSGFIGQTLVRWVHFKVLDIRELAVWGAKKLEQSRHWYKVINDGIEYLLSP